MKKIGVILIAIAILGLAGCAGSSKKGGTSEPFVVDMSTLTVVALDGTPIGDGTAVKNPKPFTKNYDDLMILFGPFPAGFDWPSHARLTVAITCYDGDGKEIAPADGNAMVSLIYDIKGDIRGPDMGPGPNTPLKEMNIGGYSGTLHKERGARSRLTNAPQAILFQNSDAKVKFIEVTSIMFHDNS
jgi:hypothetical protein